MKRAFLIIVNPVAGSKDKKVLLTKTISYLDHYEIPHQTLFTQHKGHASHFIKETFPKQCTDILIIGGDGTLNEVVNGLFSKGLSIPISIIPTGTGNDFIKSVPFPKSLDQQLATAVSGKTMAVDVGRCNDRYFLNTMGFGFDGKVVAIMEDSGKKFTGHLAYLYTVLHTVTRFKEPKVSFSIDGIKRNEHIFLMAINNGTTYGGGFYITPNAVVDDGFFDVCLIKKISTWRRYLNLPKLQRGTHTKVKEIEMLRCKTLHVEFAENVHAHVDGEYIASPPFEISILPKAQEIRISG